MRGSSLWTCCYLPAAARLQETVAPRTITRRNNQGPARQTRTLPTPPTRKSTFLPIAVSSPPLTLSAPRRKMPVQQKPVQQRSVQRRPVQQRLSIKQRPVQQRPVGRYRAEYSELAPAQQQTYNDVFSRALRSQDVHAPPELVLNALEATAEFL